MLHYQQFLIAGLLFSAVWWGLLQTAYKDSSFVTFLPLWAIVALGVYAVGSVVYGTLSFKDTPEASKELEQQIKEAKLEMTKRGVVKKETKKKR